MDTGSGHAILARDVHVAGNKDKILIMLYTSKTHDVSVSPQEIKITGIKDHRLYTPNQTTFLPLPVNKTLHGTQGWIF